VDPMSLRSQQQLEFARRFATLGYQGLKYYLRDIARRENTRKPRASWQKILEACETPQGTQDDIVFRYLASMHHRVMQALIEGTIGRRAASETGFRHVLHWWNTLSGHPCTYVNIPCRSEFEGVEYSTQGSGNPIQSSRWMGYGPSPEELEQVCEVMWRYLRSTDSATVEEAQKIDMEYPPVADKDRPDDVAATKFGRRYLVSANAVEQIGVWIGQVRQTVINPAKLSMTAEQLKEPLPWSFQEVGFGVKGIVRAQDHLSHDGTNYLFGLYTSVLRAKFGRLFEIKQWCLNLVARPEEADIAEILGSVVGGTYHTCCGLNPHLAGGASMQGRNAINKDNWAFMYEEVKQIVSSSSIWKTNWRVDEEKNERLVRAVDGMKQLPQHRTDFDHSEKDVLEKERELEQKREQIRVLEERGKARNSLKEVLRRAKEGQGS
jgi:hypothetical protein